MLGVCGDKKQNTTRLGVRVGVRVRVRVRGWVGSTPVYLDPTRKRFVGVTIVKNRQPDTWKIDPQPLLRRTPRVSRTRGTLDQAACLQ